MLNIVQGVKNMGVPLDDDWIYETFGIEKPKDYDQQKEAAEAQRLAIRESLEGKNGKEDDDDHDEGKDDDKKPLNSDKKSFKDRLRGFFGVAPATGADTDF